MFHAAVRCKPSCTERSLEALSRYLVLFVASVPNPFIIRIARTNAPNNGNRTLARNYFCHFQRLLQHFLLPTLHHSR